MNTLLITLVWFFLLPDLNNVDTESFDTTKWLDADIFIINNVLTVLIITLVVFIIADFISSFLNKKIEY